MMAFIFPESVTMKLNQLLAIYLLLLEVQVIQKFTPDILIPVHDKLCNYCLLINTILDKWKSAIVTTFI